MSKDESSSPSGAPRFLETDFVKEALDRLSDGLGAREPFLLVTGDAGTGKTALLNAAVLRWGKAATIAFVADPAMNRVELLEDIVRRFGVEPPQGATRPQLTACLEAAIAEARQQGRVPVVVIDDAHEVADDVLGGLRLLANVSAQAGGPLEIVLAGLPALEARLAEPALETVRQRIGVHIVMRPLSAKETRRYVHEVVAAGEKDPAALYPKTVCRELHTYARGVPRTLQALASEAARLAGKAGAQSVGAEHVAQAATQMGLERVAGNHVSDVVRNTAPAASPVDSAPVAAAIAPTPDDHEPIPRPPHDSEEDGELKPPGDPAKASEWIGRFISPDEPRFGDLIGTGQLIEFAEGDPETEGGSNGDASLAPPKRRRRGRVVRRRSYSRSRHSGWLTNATIALVALAAIVVLAGPTRRMVATGMEVIAASAEKHSVERVQAPVAGAATSSDPVENTATVTSDAAGEARKSTATARVPTPPTRSESKPDVPARKDDSPGQMWVVDVGSYADASAAGIDRERLADATGLKGWLVRSSEGGATVYRVVLGIYSSRERAEHGSTLLLEQRLVSEANVIPLPPRSQRL